MFKVNAISTVPADSTPSSPESNKKRVRPSSDFGTLLDWTQASPEKKRPKENNGSRPLPELADLTTQVATPQIVPPTPRKVRPMPDFGGFTNQSASSRIAPPPTPSKAKVRPVPLPDFAGFAAQVTTSRVAPPATPSKVRSERGRAIIPESPHQTLFSNASRYQYLNHSGLTIDVAPFAKGTFMQAFSVTSDQPVIPEVPNEQILIKLYHGEKTGFPKVPTFMANSLDNYHEAQRLGIPVSRIYNSDTALQNNLFVVEKIPYALNIDEESQIEQVCQMFKLSYENKVAFDLSRDNLRVSNNGTVVLIDFVEKPFDFENTDKLRIFAIQYLKSWAKACGSRDAAEKMLAHLTKDLSGFDPEWNRMALDEMFPQMVSPLFG